MSVPSLCCPGHIIKVGFARCTISAVLLKAGDVYAVTAGHAFAKSSGTEVTVFRYARHVKVGRARASLSDEHNDVGVVRLIRRDLARSAPDDGVIIGAPLSLDELRTKTNQVSTIYFRFRPPVKAIFHHITSGNRFEVTAETMGTEGDSGAPCYFEEGGVLRLAGLYRRRRKDNTMEFENPIDGLNKLDFQLT